MYNENVKIEIEGTKMLVELLTLEEPKTWDHPGHYEIQDWQATVLEGIDEGSVLRPDIITDREHDQIMAAVEEQLGVLTIHA